MQEWLAPLMERYKTLKTQEGKEVDVRVLCPGAGLEYLARLSEAAKSIFANLQLPQNCFMHKFALINDNSSLVGFKLNKGEAEEREENGYRERAAMQTLCPIRNSPPKEFPSAARILRKEKEGEREDK